MTNNKTKNPTWMDSNFRNETVQKIIRPRKNRLTPDEEINVGV